MEREVVEGLASQIVVGQSFGCIDEVFAGVILGIDLVVHDALRHGLVGVDGCRGVGDRKSGRRSDVARRCMGDCGSRSLGRGCRGRVAAHECSECEGQDGCTKHNLPSNLHETSPVGLRHESYPTGLEYCHLATGEACLIRAWPTILGVFLKFMKTTISLSTPAELETESLVAVVLDHAEPAPNEKEKDKKPQLRVATNDPIVQSVAADLLASGEVAGKAFETNLLHKPANAKAKRLLLISGGGAKKFSSYDLRRVAGAAVRALKSRGIRSFAFIAPPGIPAEEAVRAIVEGAHVGNFDPDYYRSDRKDQKIDALTVIASGDKAALEKVANEAQVIGESQNFTRDLVNEPSNRMTPTILADRAKKMCAEVGLKCEVFGADKIKEMKMGAFWSVAQGSDEPPALIVMKYEPAGAPEKPMLGLVGKGNYF